MSFFYFKHYSLVLLYGTYSRKQLITIARTNHENTTIMQYFIEHSRLIVHNMHFILCDVRSPKITLHKAMHTLKNHAITCYLSC